MHLVAEGRAEFMVASHNQESIEKATQLMHELDLPPRESPVYFGQLLGMADPLTYVLGANGYKVRLRFLRRWHLVLASSRAWSFPAVQEHSIQLAWSFWSKCLAVCLKHPNASLGSAACVWLCLPLIQHSTFPAFCKGLNEGLGGNAEHCSKIPSRALHGR